MIRLIALIALIAPLAAAFSLCGLSSPHNFVPYNRHFETDVPVMYPHTENELRDIIQTARKYGCRVRPVGTAHSVDGLVAQKSETDVVVVNLANLKPPVEWDKRFHKQRLKVRMAAGATLLDLYAFIRPKGYLLSTFPSGWIFSLAGVFLTPSVHGGTINEDRLTTLLTGVRAVLPDGRIIEALTEHEIRAWRGSMGMLGIVTAVEIRVRKDEGIKFSVDQFQLQHWRKDNVESKISRSMQGLDHVDYFWNSYTDDVLAFKASFNGDPSFMCNSTAPYYDTMQKRYPSLGKGTPTSKLQNLVEAGAQVTPGHVQAGRAMKFLHEKLSKIRHYPRDGFFVEPEGSFYSDNVEVQVPCPADCIHDGTLFGIMHETRKYLRRIRNQTPNFPTGPLGIRFMTVHDDDIFMLNYLPKGRYILFETISFRDTTTHKEPNNEHFAALERQWNKFTKRHFKHHNKKRPRGYCWKCRGGRRSRWRRGECRRRMNQYHTGKQWGWGHIDGLPKPYAFQNDRAARKYFAPWQRKRFLRQARHNDPTGMFSAGELPRLLGVSSVKFDPRHSSKETTQGAKTVCGIFGNSACVSGCCCQDQLRCADTLNQCTESGAAVGEPCLQHCSCISRVCGIHGKCI